jgi:F0F1-type ATP synthase delta subunit
MESDDDDTLAEDICKELSQTAKELSEQVETTTRLYESVCMKIAEKEAMLANYILTPKDKAAKKWLKTLSLNSSVLTYDEFLDAFLTLYEKEGRMDFATRTLVLRPEDAKLFDLPETSSIYALLGALPTVFN